MQFCLIVYDNVLSLKFIMFFFYFNNATPLELAQGCQEIEKILMGQEDFENPHENNIETEES